jgi:hypothetical protein
MTGENSMKNLDVSATNPGDLEKARRGHELKQLWFLLAADLDIVKADWLLHMFDKASAGGPKSVERFKKLDLWARQPPKSCYRNYDRDENGHWRRKRGGLLHDAKTPKVDPKEAFRAAMMYSPIT